MNHRPVPSARLRVPRTAPALLVALVASSALAFAATAAAAPSSACSVCGKNLVKNPGAEAGKGQNAQNESGAVPGWAKTAGAFGAVTYTAPGFWFAASSLGPKDKGKNYFFGGGVGGGTFHQSVGTQTIRLPASAVGHKATLSGWLGNYGADTSQVRAEFMNAAGKQLAAVRIGPDTTIGESNMALRTRTATVPAGTKTVDVVITFTDHNNANEAGADDVSLVLS